MPLTKLIFTDVCQFLSRMKLCSRTPLKIRLCLPDSKRLKWRVIRELGLLNNMKPNVHSIVICPYNVTPVEKVIIVNNAARKVALTENRDMVSVVVVGVWPHKSVDKTWLSDAGNTLLPLRAGKANHRDIKGPPDGQVQCRLSGHRQQQISQDDAVMSFCQQCAASCC